MAGSRITKGCYMVLVSLLKSAVLTVKLASSDDLKEQHFNFSCVVKHIRQLLRGLDFRPAQAERLSPS